MRLLPEDPTPDMLTVAHAVSTLKPAEAVPDHLWEEQRKEAFKALYYAFTARAIPADDLFSATKDLLREVEQFVRQREDLSWDVQTRLRRAMHRVRRAFAKAEGQPLPDDEQAAKQERPPVAE
jgi:hypothetical protein